MYLSNINIRHKLRLNQSPDMLLHVFPQHSVQATEHSRPYFLQLQRFESQFVLHLQYIVFRSSSGAGGLRHS